MTNLIPLFYEKITLDGSTPKALTTDYYAPSSGDYRGKIAARVYLTITGNPIRCHFVAGASFSNDQGMVLPVGMHSFDLSLAAMQNFRAISASTSSTLHVTYFFPANIDGERPLPTRIN